MSSYAIVSSALVVRAVVQFFGSPDFPAEPKNEASAVAIIQEWNGASGNPLQLEAGDVLMKTAPGFRGQYAGPGYSWSPGLQMFVPPKPFPSWVLNVQTDAWESTVPIPDDGQRYRWNEDARAWIVIR